MSKPFVFISYSQKDKEFVDQLSEKLNNSGIDTWVDVQQIVPGSMWQDEIKRGIESAGLFLIVLSENYLSSSWTSIELAIASKKKIIPIKISEFLTESLPNYVKQMQWIDFTKNFTNGFELLIKTIPKNYVNKQPIATKVKRSKGYVFLSFCEEDSYFVAGLRDFLKSQEFGYWDFEEGDRNYHTHFFLELESVINESVAVLSIISPNWKKSRWSIREFFYSEEIGKPVLLLRAKITKPILAIAGLPYIDFVDETEKGFERLEQELKKRLN